MGFNLLLALWATFQLKNNIRSAPASTALTLASHQSHNTHTTNRHLYGSGEKNGEQRRTKVNNRDASTGGALKMHILERSDVEQCKNQAHSFSSYRFTLV